VAFLPDDMQRYDAIYRSFWTQLLGWLVRGSDFLLAGLLPEDGSTHLRARPACQPAGHLPARAAEKLVPALEVIDPKGKRTPVTPARSQAYGAALVGAYTPTEIGDYTAVLHTGAGKAHALEAVFAVYESRQEDLITEADPELMRQIAETSGGGVATATASPNCPSG